jgi:prepilin-type processing-associated H-X9-DG protein
MAWTKTKTAVVAAVVIILAARTTNVMERNSGDQDSFQGKSDARFDEAKKWALAFIMFADAHGNQLPNNFDQAKAYVPGLSDSNWEIVSGGDENSFVNPSKTILLREKESRQFPGGKFLKVYAFADGHAQRISSPDNNFAALEKQRGFLIRPAKN